MGFIKAVQTCLGKYATFSGRASRREYWWWGLLVTGAPLVLFLVSVIVDVMLGMLLLSIVALLIMLGLAVPSLAVTIRRLHDTGRSAWYLLFSLVPFGGLYLLYVYVQPSSGEANAYGPPPDA